MIDFNKLMNTPMQSVQNVRIPSIFQEAIYSAVRDTSDPILIEAVAGSGKTTTIIDATEWTSDPTMFLAFAKANAEDVKTKIMKGEAKTLNALGHRLWMINRPGAKIDFHKDESIIAAVCQNPEFKRKHGWTIGRLISAAKNNGYALEDEGSAGDFAHFITESDWADVDDADIQEVATAAYRAFCKSREMDSVFDFNDQLYGPLFHGWEFPSFGTILVDEAQDLNRVQHLFVESLVVAGARLIAVGDRNQAIYAFRGALANSMDLMKAHFRMKELPLSICYRCPTSVIMQAQQIVPHIQARPDAPAGRVYAQPFLDLPKSGAFADSATCRHGIHPYACFEGCDPRNLNEDPEFWPDGHMIICRNNAPLFAAVMRSVRARRPCRVMSNALDGLESFIKKFRVDTVRELYPKLERWLQKELAAAEEKQMPWKVAALEDKVATVISLCEGFTFISEVVNLVRSLKEGRTGPIFATIHKAKGLEADHVYFLRPDLVPGWWIKEPEALQQEMNLRYVAITRARQTLTYGVRG